MSAENYVERTEPCGACGLQALVSREERKNGSGEVVTSIIRMTRCPNPECVHFAQRAADELASPLLAAGAKSKLTKRQRKAFQRLEGEDVYAWIARTHRSLPFGDLPRLLLMRNKDRPQVEAIQLLADLKMVQWTRALVFGTFFLGVCTVVAAFIVR